MTRDEARRMILEVLAGIAPEVSPDEVDGDEELTLAFDLDSIDFLNVVEGVSKAVGRDIPESDYQAIATLDAFATYLSDTAA